MSEDPHRRRVADLHFHLLPGVDDGPETMDQSVELARVAAGQGTRIVVTTPHVRADFVTDVFELPGRVREIRAALETAGIELEVLGGAELSHEMVARLEQSELELLAQGPAHARWLLVESPFEGMDPGFHEATEELRDRGFGVVLAHPERGADATEHGSPGLHHELAQGALLQVNAQSLTGGHGSRPHAVAHALVRDGLAGLVCSDAHGPSRPPALPAGRAAMERAGVPEPIPRALTVGAPRRLLERGFRAPAPSWTSRRARAGAAL